jgi:YbgC/YbaW family acyl-CoA thioester hydrolase
MGKLMTLAQLQYGKLNVINKLYFLKKPMFKTKRKINFYDCDPAGVLFFGRIFELCHSAYEELIAGFDLKEDYWNNEEYIVPILNSEAHYRKPMKYGEDISVEIKVSKLKSSSFELDFVCRNDKDEECTHVRTVHVCVDKSTWKKQPLKKEIHSRLSEYLV